MERFAYLGVIVAVLAYAWSAIFIRMAVEAPPLAIAFYRMLIASIVWTPAYWWKPKGIAPTPLTSRQRKLILLSGLFLCFHFATWIASLRHTTVASAVFMILMQPIMVAIVAHFWLKERLRTQHIVGLIVTILGALIITWGDVQIKPEYLGGDLLALLGAGLAGAYLLVGRIVRPDHPEHGEGVPLHRYIPLVYWTATIGLLILCLANGVTLSGFGSDTWWALLGVGLIPTVIGHSLFNWAIRYLPALPVNISLVGEPIGATLLAFWIFHETPATGIFIGGPLMILAVVVIVMTPQRMKVR